MTRTILIYNNIYIYDESTSGRLAYRIKYIEPRIVPIGTIISYLGTSAPSNFLKCDGGTYNKSDYTDLFNLLYQLPSATRSTWGSANWTSQFNTPNLQGEFLRGTGSNSHSGMGSGSSVGIHQNATSIPSYHTYDSGSSYANFHTSKTSKSATDRDSSNPTAGITTQYRYIDFKTSSDTAALIHSFTARPTNTSVLFCIKY